MLIQGSQLFGHTHDLLVGHDNLLDKLRVVGPHQVQLLDKL